MFIYGSSLYFCKSQCDNQFVVIGDNNQVYIKKGYTSDQKYGVKDAPNVLNCEEPKDFWISWSNGDIKVGENYSKSYIYDGLPSTVYVTMFSVNKLCVLSKLILQSKKYLLKTNLAF